MLLELRNWCHTDKFFQFSVMILLLKIIVMLFMIQKGSITYSCIGPDIRGQT